MRPDPLIDQSKFIEDTYSEWYHHHLALAAFVRQYH
jgi:hypothetical protein